MIMVQDGTIHLAEHPHEEIPLNNSYRLKKQIINMFILLVENTGNDDVVE